MLAIFVIMPSKFADASKKKLHKKMLKILKHTSQVSSHLSKKHRFYKGGPNGSKYILHIYMVQKAQPLLGKDLWS